MRSLIAPRPASGFAPVAVGLLTASLLAMTLAGCQGLEDPGTHVAGFTLIDPTERHPIMVSQQPATTSIHVAHGSQGLTPAQKAHVAGFLQRYRATDAGNSKLVIAVPSGSPNESAVVQAVADVRRLISDYGFAESNVAIEPYHERRNASAPIRLSYLRYVAEGPECAQWNTNLADDRRNLPYPNFGCAQQHNLAAQIANPADLVGPRTMDPSDQERRTVVFDKQRQGGITRSERADDETVQGRTTKDK
jgi:pilus assembly protein CpaD